MYETKWNRPLLRIVYITLKYLAFTKHNIMDRSVNLDTLKSWVFKEDLSFFQHNKMEKMKL